MKKFFKGYVAGILTTAVLFSGVAYAQDYVKLIVNGHEIQSDVPPQVINGRTMVPARFLAEALGAKVDWDAQNNAVVVTSKNAVSNNVAAVDLVNTLIPYRLQNAKQEPLTITGENFNNAYLIDGGEIDWNLQGKYKKVTFYVGVPDNDTKGLGYEFDVYVDGKEIEINSVQTSDGLKQFTYDITGAKNLTIKSVYFYGADVVNPQVQ